MRPRAPWPLAFALAIAGCAMSQRSDSDAAITGDWGGENVALSLSPAGGSIEYGCAVGTLDAPVIPDRNGRFSVVGGHTRQAGIVPIDAPAPSVQPALYRGAVSDAKMVLEVSSEGALLGRYELRRGVVPRLFKCL